MRKVALYFVIGLTTFSELTSLIGFLLTRNAEAAFVFQLPALICFYKILSYLYPTGNAATHPLVALIQAVFKIKSP